MREGGCLGPIPTILNVIRWTDEVIVQGKGRKGKESSGMRGGDDDGRGAGIALACFGCGGRRGLVRLVNFGLTWLGRLLLVFVFILSVFYLGYFHLLHSTILLYSTVCCRLTSGEPIMVFFHDHIYLSTQH